jgi:hypothetical protein
MCTESFWQKRSTDDPTKCKLSSGGVAVIVILTIAVTGALVSILWRSFCRGKAATSINSVDDGGTISTRDAKKRVIQQPLLGSDV